MNSADTEHKYMFKMRSIVTKKLARLSKITFFYIVFHLYATNIHKYAILIQE